MLKVTVVGDCQRATANNHKTQGERVFALWVKSIFEYLAKRLPDHDARLQV